MPDNAETALHALIEAQRNSVCNADYDALWAMTADWLYRLAPTLLAEREKDRARIERLEKALEWYSKAAVRHFESDLGGRAMGALTDTRALPTTEAQNG